MHLYRLHEGLTNRNTNHAILTLIDVVMVVPPMLRQENSGAGVLCGSCCLRHVVVSRCQFAHSSIDGLDLLKRLLHNLERVHPCGREQSGGIVMASPAGALKQCTRFVAQAVVENTNNELVGLEQLKDA